LRGVGWRIIKCCDGRRRQTHGKHNQPRHGTLGRQRQTDACIMHQRECAFDGQTRSGCHQPAKLGAALRCDTAAGPCLLRAAAGRIEGLVTRRARARTHTHTHTTHTHTTHTPHTQAQSIGAHTHTPSSARMHVAARFLAPTAHMRVGGRAGARRLAGPSPTFSCHHEQYPATQQLLMT
jgi:hypothetical protein